MFYQIYQRGQFVVHKRLLIFLQGIILPTCPPTLFATITKSLYQFADYASEYGIKRSGHSYPLDRNSGGIYSGGITVFRASENNGYALLKNPYRVSFVSVPAINRPELEKRSNRYYIAGPLVEPAKEKIRTILRIGGKYGHGALVLSAFGCGAFANPPHHVALLFREVFNDMKR
jgi:uncharacterized protein (TIGR02452 family)